MPKKPGFNMAVFYNIKYCIIMAWSACIPMPGMVGKPGITEFCAAWFWA
jgi:hypothetical protein